MPPNGCPTSGNSSRQSRMPNMSTAKIFTCTDPNLIPILEELKRREPIFHTPEFGTSRADFEKAIAPDYWEASASGRRYSREFILTELEKHPPVDAAYVGWQSHDHAVRQLGSDTYLMTYTLRQLERITRRATIWQKTSEGWRILYHQGTIVSAEEDDTYPSDWLHSPPGAKQETNKTDSEIGSDHAGISESIFANPASPTHS